MAGLQPVDRVRRLCLALPEATERLSHGEPTWFVRDRKVFVMFADRHHDDRLALWCPAPPGEQRARVDAEPERYFVPPYVGGRGWLGVYLDVPVDWAELAEIITDAYRQVAPKRLVAALDAGSAGAPGTGGGGRPSAVERPAGDHGARRRGERADPLLADREHPVGPGRAGEPEA